MQNYTAVPQPTSTKFQEEADLTSDRMVCVRYSGVVPITVEGHVTGCRYRFTAHDELHQVHLRDAAALVRTGFFRLQEN